MSSLGQSGAREAVDGILNKIEHGDATDRAGALSSLAYVDDARAQTAIAKMIEDDDATVELPGGCFLETPGEDYPPLETYPTCTAAGAGNILRVLWYSPRKSPWTGSFNSRFSP